MCINAWVYYKIIMRIMVIFIEHILQIVLRLAHQEKIKVYNCFMENVYSENIFTMNECYSLCDNYYYQSHDPPSYILLIPSSQFLFPSILSSPAGKTTTYQSVKAYAVPGGVMARTLTDILKRPNGEFDNLSSDPFSFVFLCSIQNLVTLIA